MQYIIRTTRQDGDTTYVMDALGKVRWTANKAEATRYAKDDAQEALDVIETVGERDNFGNTFKHEMVIV